MPQMSPMNWTIISLLFLLSLSLLISFHKKESEAQKATVLKNKKTLWMW
uniref:ATP synthase subunit 8 n=1 Tax=Unionicola foili TaxID=350889 RepID=B3W611_9ACAR|nr:ATP synthase F0 subunit 8 [Unionicola foili]ACF19638.1 ATP synthase subunit 8 [Unionicola foili]